MTSERAAARPRAVTAHATIIPRTFTAALRRAAPQKHDNGRLNEKVPVVEVVIEVPRGSFLKRGSTGHVDFVSPLPCPYNYGSVPTHVGLDGDLLDAVVLGPRLRLGTTVRVKAWGGVTLVDRGMADDKLVCSVTPVTSAERKAVLRFFRFYSTCKALLNLWRGRSGRNACDGWCAAEFALARAKLRDETWAGPSVEF